MTKNEQRQQPAMPSNVDASLSLFDKFAGASARMVSRAPFFAAAVMLVVAWLIEGVIKMVVAGSPSAFLDDKYQLQINTLTTIITFLLVALLQNTETRSDEATQEKLNAIADGLGDLMLKMASKADSGDLQEDVRELRAAVGLEDIVSASDDR